MPDWLIEGDLTLLILVGLAGCLCVFIWTKTRKQLWLALAIAGFVFLGLLLLLDWRFESDREQITGNINSMAAAVAPHDYETIFKHIASDFHYAAVNKSEFRRTCESRGNRVHGMTVWGIRVANVDTAKNDADVSFQFKIRADGLAEEAFYLCKGTWVKEKDGKWRLQTFKVYPLSSADQPLSIPGVG